MFWVWKLLKQKVLRVFRLKTSPWEKNHMLNKKKFSNVVFQLWGNTKTLSGCLTSFTLAILRRSGSQLILLSGLATKTDIFPISCKFHHLLLCFTLHTQYSSKCRQHKDENNISREAESYSVMIGCAAVRFWSQIL